MGWRVSYSHSCSDTLVIMTVGEKGGDSGSGGWLSLCWMEVGVLLKLIDTALVIFTSKI